MKLQFNNQTRIETDQLVINNLKRKGWIEVQEVEQEHIQSSSEAWEVGRQYINFFFDADKKQMLLAKLMLGNDEQKQKIVAIFQWIEALEKEAINNPSTFSPDTVPPYIYEDI